MPNIYKICSSRQEQVDLLNEILKKQPDFKEGMNIIAKDSGNGEVEWSGNTSIRGAKEVYARVLQEHLPNIKIV